jgi:diketogulonate reductase-like aldo/keto reductase
MAASGVPTLSAPRELNDGTTIPAIGFGTSQLSGQKAIEAVGSALREGYRLIDTAASYGNEAEVGEAIRRSDVPREELVVTSKIPGSHHAYDDAIRSTEESLQRLGLERLDLHLVHWPNPKLGRYPETWRALVDLRERGLVRSIGVSNFTEQHLARIIEDTGVTPVVNQIELHPFFPQQGMREVHERLGIVTESWSPLGRRRAPFEAAPVAEAAKRHGVSPAQVVLRWHLQLGALPIPKSSTPERQRENLDVDGFELSGAEVDAITGMAEPDGRLFGGDPETFQDV